MSSSPAWVVGRHLGSANLEEFFFVAEILFGVAEEGSTTLGVGGCLGLVGCVEVGDQGSAAADCFVGEG